MKRIQVTKKYVAFVKNIEGVSRITDKTDLLPVGEHPCADEFSIIETDDKSTYDSWEEYRPLDPVLDNRAKQLRRIRTYLRSLSDSDINDPTVLRRVIKSLVIVLDEQVNLSEN